MSSASIVVTGVDVQAPMSLKAAAAELGWQPQINLATGVGLYANWLRTADF